MADNNDRLTDIIEREEKSLGYDHTKSRDYNAPKFGDYLELSKKLFKGEDINKYFQFTEDNVTIQSYFENTILSPMMGKRAALELIRKDNTVSGIVSIQVAWRRFKNDLDSGKIQFLGIIPKKITTEDIEKRMEGSSYRVPLSARTLAKRFNQVASPTPQSAQNSNKPSNIQNGMKLS